MRQSTTNRRAVATENSSGGKKGAEADWAVDVRLGVERSGSERWSAEEEEGEREAGRGTPLRIPTTARATRSEGAVAGGPARTNEHGGIRAWIEY